MVYWRVGDLANFSIGAWARWRFGTLVCWHFGALALWHFHWHSQTWLMVAMDFHLWAINDRLKGMFLFYESDYTFLLID